MMSRQENYRATIGLLMALALLVSLAAGCNVEPEPVPTSTPQPLPQAAVTVPASPTVNPVLPESESAIGLSIGVSNPTQAGLAAEGEPDSPGATSTPQPTQATLPMMISAPDGLVLQATYYGPALHPAPGVLLLHMLSSDRTAWEPLAGALQRSGYAVLALDLRGHGETGGQTNWALAPSDVDTALQTLRELPGVDSQRIAVIGASIGANLAINACAGSAVCVTSVLLSPGLDYRGITTSDGVARLGTRPLLIAASENDANNPGDSITLDNLAGGDHRLILYPDAGHGTDMLLAQPDLVQEIVSWLARYMPAPA